jgi:hypothetical protein
VCAHIATQAGKEGLASERLGNYGFSLQALEQMPGLALLLEPYIGGLGAY